MDTIDQYLNVMRHIRNTDRQIREESYIISQSRASIQTLVTAKKVIVEHAESLEDTLRSNVVNSNKEM